MKKKYVTCAIGGAFILVFLIGLCAALYPFIGNYLNSRSQAQAVAHYFEDVSGMDGEKIQEALEAAREYNRQLLRESNRFEFTPESTQAYRARLNAGRGVMGILTIGKIDVKLPIYHGTDEGVLQEGLGHMQGTSLPVGGIGTHSFITGHRGLPSSTLLTHLNKLAEGDVFTLFVLGETLTYRVDDIQTVLPNQLRTLDIDPDMDYCTLVTCTPYGVNTHRLLVRGQRTENAPGEDWKEIHANAKRLEKFNIILLFMVPALPALLIFTVLRCRKIRKGGIVYL
ncbi:MAG: class C sortase [Oscillospiraceae bacterium]|nr:class C sortase [Oscillospiraceae bacterium]